VKAIEEDIRATLAMLRRHINPLESPLYRLPPDLFPEVASHLASETDLVNVTHVSYHLRNTLLSYPSLWSHLNFAHEMRARAFFERSGQAPLHIDMVRDVTRTVGSLAELRQQSKRIATLKLRLWPIQKVFLSEPLSSLRRLEIFFEYYDDDWDEEWDTSWAPVWGPTKKATSWFFPSLTSLIVYGLNPITFFAPNLRCLKFGEPIGLSGTGDLISFLDNYPLLEHLDICYVRYEPRNEHDLVISLPSLRTYTQTTLCKADSLMVFNKLSLPPFCSVTLRCKTHGGTAQAADYILPDFQNPDYLAEIKRVKIRTTYDADGNGGAGTLELINTKGTKVCFERMVSKEGYLLFGQENDKHAHNVAHLNLVRNLDGRSVEILCIDGCASRDVRGAAVEFLKGALGFGNVRTLILSRSAVRPCLSALDEGPGASDHGQWLLSLYTLIIHASTSRYDLYNEVLQPLLSVAWKRKVVRSPFRSVSLFLRDGPYSDWRWDGALDRLRRCVGKLEVVMGEDVLDWNVDKYFLDGLEHLEKDRDIQWD